MDATKKPLLIPPEFSNYAEKYEIFETVEHLIKQLVIHQPDDPLQFLVTLLEQDEKAPHIIVQGPPASGKRTMAKTVARTLGCIHLNLEYLLVDLESPEAKQAKMYVESKKEVPTDLWISLIHERLKKSDCVKQGWVLEGFPSNRSQALALQVAGIIPRHFVLLDAPDTVLIERAVGKRIDPQTGDIYHATFDPASEVDVAMRLVPDTNSSEPVMIQRLNQYHRTIDGVLSCYNKIVKRINADQPKADVFSQ
ncbi:adenylate kinase 8-like, partial [Paramuricea clavata]